MRNLDTTKIGRWWWTLDRWMLFALFSLIFIGIILNFAGTPLIAKKLGHTPYHLLQKQLLFLIPSLGILLVTSMAPLLTLRNICFVLLFIFILLLIGTLLFGIDIKGARRWIRIAGFSLQSSEFIKPAFAVTSAWFFAHAKTSHDNLGRYVSTIIFLTIVLLLLMQPDLGMTFIISSIWFVQFFLSGLPILSVIIIGILGLVGIVGAYLFFPHVASRIDRFFDPQSGDNYQINKSLEAFTSGGFFGKGPGEGKIKAHLPDAHADFIFSVAGEEFGLVVCLSIVFLYIFIILRCFWRLYSKENLFSLLAGTGLCVQFGTQAMVNMASCLRLIPTKGMTLPFLSYGGSSLLSLSFGMGILLAFTRKTRVKK